MGDPADDKRTSKKRRSLISRSPTPVSVEPREETPAPRPPRAEDHVPDSFVGVPGSFIGLVGLTADATDAPEPAALGRREAEPAPPVSPATSPPRAPVPRQAAIADLETPLYAPRQPVREDLPDDGPDRTLPPERFPQPPLTPDFRAKPVVAAGWTAPPPPARSTRARPGPSPTVVVATILTAAIVLAVFLVVGAFGGASESEPSPPLLAPGTAVSAPAPVVRPEPPPPPPVEEAPPATVAPSAPQPPPAPGPTTIIRDGTKKVRLGKRKDPEPSQ